LLLPPQVPFAVNHAASRQLLSGWPFSLLLLLRGAVKVGNRYRSRQFTVTVTPQNICCLSNVPPSQWMPLMSVCFISGASRLH
jgi:hypothetical protein